ncbi:MAG: hypothetical protein ABJC13_18300 [Acidobacteriota bacterium]
MKSARWAGSLVLGLFLVGGIANAGSQNICAKLFLNGFNNSSVTAGYRVTDVAASFHSCSAGSGSSCSACAGATFQPKNAGNYLCLPSNLLYSISPSCQTLITSGSSNCTANNTKDQVCSGMSVVMPACNWRTNDNDNEADWTWSLSLNGSTVIVNCSTNNYQGYEQ